MLADAEAGEVTPAATADADGTCADSQGISIVEHDDLVVGGEPQITFDPAAEFERRGESGQAVFGKAGAVMQASVRKTERTRPKGIKIPRIRL